jgi:uncharacterized protein (DUF924 family)
VVCTIPASTNQQLQFLGFEKQGKGYMMYEDILKFWFKDIEPKMWWTSDPQFDLDILEQAKQAEFSSWRKSARGRLAEIIVLDQFSRNIYRNTPQAFAQDPAALVLSQEALAVGAHLELEAIERSFLLMPFMHSESAKIHIEAEKLFLEFAPQSNYEAELAHKVIIDRFGRYPHRNQILKRDSTEEELEFLKQPNSRF